MLVICFSLPNIPFLFCLKKVSFSTVDFVSSWLSLDDEVTMVGRRALRSRPGISNEDVNACKKPAAPKRGKLTGEKSGGKNSVHASPADTPVVPSADGDEGNKETSHRESPRLKCSMDVESKENEPPKVPETEGTTKTKLRSSRRIIEPTSSASSPASPTRTSRSRSKASQSVVKSLVESQSVEKSCIGENKKCPSRDESKSAELRKTMDGEKTSATEKPAEATSAGAKKTKAKEPLKALSTRIKNSSKKMMESESESVNEKSLEVPSMGAMGSTKAENEDQFTPTIDPPNPTKRTKRAADASLSIKKNSIASSNDAKSSLNLDSESASENLKLDESSSKAVKKRTKTVKKLTASKKKNMKQKATNGNVGGKLLRVNASAESKDTPSQSTASSASENDPSSVESSNLSTESTESSLPSGPRPSRRSASPASAKKPTSRLSNSGETAASVQGPSGDPLAAASVSNTSKKRVSFADESSGPESLASAKKPRRSSSSSSIAASSPSAASPSAASSPVVNSNPFPKIAKSASAKSRAKKVVGKAATKRVIKPKLIEVETDPYDFDEEDTIDARAAPLIDVSQVPRTTAEEMPAPGGRVEEMERSICLSASKKRKKEKVGKPSGKGTTAAVAKKKKLSVRVL